MPRSIVFKAVIGFAVVFTPCLVSAQNLFTGFENLFTKPLSYTVTYTPKGPVIDGNITDEVWSHAAWSADFQDIEGALKPVPPYQTQIKMLWGDSCLYIAAKLQEPQVWGTLKKHDAVIYHDNDFEVFIDPDNTTHQYFEIEVNALNTVFDLFLNKPYRNGGNPLISWDTPGIRTAVKIQGTLNNPKDKDVSWTVEMAIPYRALTLGMRPVTPAEGSLWRINFSRVEWDTKLANGQYVKLTDNAGRALPEHNWVWSPQGLINMHYPERWGYLVFTKQTKPATFVLPNAEEQKSYLWLIYYKQKQYLSEHKHYAISLHDLDLPETVSLNGQYIQLKLEATRHQFMAIISNSETIWMIDQDGLVQQARNSDK